MQRNSLKCIAVGMALIALGTASELSAQTRAAPGGGAELKLSFAPIVRKTGPAVVNIFARRNVVEQRQGWVFNDPFFRRFFGEQLPFGGGGGNTSRVENSLGSGVIVRADGIIVTNNHVIKMPMISKWCSPTAANLMRLCCLRINAQTSRSCG